MQMYGAFSLLNDNYIIEEGSNANGVELEFVSNRIAWATQGTGGNSKNTIGYFLVCPASVTASGALHFRCTGTWK